jgi:hypothetical protein
MINMVIKELRRAESKCKGPCNDYIEVEDLIQENVFKMLKAMLKSKFNCIILYLYDSITLDWSSKKFAEHKNKTESKTE